VTSITTHANYYELNGAFVDGVGFSNDEIISFDFTQTGNVGNTGATGATGPTGVVTATAPITYNSGTQTVGIDLTNIAQRNTTNTFTSNQTINAGVLVGTQVAGTVAVSGQIRTSSDVGSNYIDTTANASSGTGPGYTARRARGTVASPAQVQTSDLLFGIFAQGWNNAGAFGPNSGAFRIIANQNFTTTGYGTAMVFETATDGTTGRAERMRITGSGTLSVGTQSSLGQLGVVSAGAGTIGAVVRGAASQTANLQEWQNSAGTVQALVSPTGGASFSGLSVTGGNIGNGTTTNMVLSTGGNRSVTLASGSPSLGGGGNVVFIGNASTVPTSNPTGGGILYVESGALKFRGSSGTVTTIANA
jgi:hypothetical protein